MFIELIMFFVIFSIILIAFKSFFEEDRSGRPVRIISWYGLIGLALLYITIALGFTGIYLLFELMGFQVLHANGALPLKNNLEYIFNVVYFSMTTLFSIGYGEWIPIGIGKLIAVIEGLFGYLLPPAFIISFMQPTKRKVD